MPLSNEEKAFVSYIIELMQSMGPVYAKRMFGGHGIFLDGLMFAIIADSVLYLKADKDSKNDFIAEGLEAFKYSKQGKKMTLSYYQAPEQALEDPEDMQFWANKAYVTALRATADK